MQLTITELAEELGCKRHRVKYAVRSQGIQPVRVIGSTKIFSEEVAVLLRQVLAPDESDRVNTPEVLC